MATAHVDNGHKKDSVAVAGRIKGEHDTTHDSPPHSEDTDELITKLTENFLVSEGDHDPHVADSTKIKKAREKTGIASAEAEIGSGLVGNAYTFASSNAKGSIGLGVVEVGSEDDITPPVSDHDEEEKIRHTVLCFNIHLERLDEE